jgi:quercetin dioxygenase-like cupin family protein
VEKHRLDQMTRGWFIGNFNPSVYMTNDFEVAVQTYAMGSIEAKHVHKVATEVTVIVSGRASINGIIYNDGDIIVMLPGEESEFSAITDVTTVVVKYPSCIGDKYVITD